MKQTLNLNGLVYEISGIFMYKNQVGVEALEKFAKDWLSGEKIDYNLCKGAFLIQIKNTLNGELTFFADNSGMRRWYYNVDTAAVSNTLIGACSNDRKMNTRAVTEFLSFECIYSLDTIVDSVKITDADNYYVIKDKTITGYSKNLKNIDEISANENELEDMMKLYCKEADARSKRYVTITGGIDSRTILSYAIFNDHKAVLDVTGNADSEDVKIAHEIASITGRDLEFIDGSKNGAWIKAAIEGAKLGCTPVCGTWRLFKKARLIGNTEEAIECGGVNGEVYKNSFINQDYPFYYGKPNWNKFIKYKVGSSAKLENICGKAIVDDVKNMHDYMVRFLECFNASDKGRAFFKAGYRIVQQRFVGISTMNGYYYDQYSPLLERSVVAMVYGVNPYSLEMQSWQRRQISKYCPMLKTVKTDRGLTADDTKMIKEWFASTWFLMKIFFERAFKHKESKSTACIEEGLNTIECKKAVERCRELGIINDSIMFEDIPEDIKDRLFTVGSIL